MKEGSFVVEEGEPGHCLYIVASGSIALRKAQPGGEVAVLTTLGAGDHFGELSLLNGLPRSADAVCLEESVCLIIERGELARCIETN